MTASFHSLVNITITSDRGKKPLKRPSFWMNNAWLWWSRWDIKMEVFLNTVGPSELTLLSFLWGQALFVVCYVSTPLRHVNRTNGRNISTKTRTKNNIKEPNIIIISLYASGIPPKTSAECISSGPSRRAYVINNRGGTARWLLPY